MSAAASNLATLNGFPAGAAVASLVASPRGNGNNAVQVTMTTVATLHLAKVFQSASTLPVTATSFAEVRANTPACIIALRTGGTGLTLSGGTAVTAANCAVASNATVTVPCGPTLTTKTLDYNSAAVPSQPCGGIKPPAGTPSVNIVKVVTIDPLGANTAVATAFSHVTTVASLKGPNGPSIAAGADIAFGWSASPTVAQLTAIGCIGSTFVSPAWNVTCPAGGTYHFGSISVGGGLTLNFAVGGSPSNTYTFSGVINAGGSGANFGPGTYSIAGGIVTGGGTTTTFGSGTYWIGPGSTGCSGGSYSICGGGASLTFGTGSFTIAGGIYTTGGSTLSIGASGTTNSFNIGPSTSGYAINTGGGGITTLGDITTGTFQTVGNVSTAGGSILTLGKAPAHDLNGALALAGTATFGAGIWSVAGNVSIGGGGGGGSVTGSGVSMITSGTFSVAAGYNNVTLTAPGSGTLKGLVVAGNGAGGASFIEGATGNSLSGAFYFPNGSIVLSGAGNVGNGVGQCLQLIGATIMLSGGSTLASACVGLAGSVSGSTVVLVQ